MRIAIIGGGLTGLTLAYYLQKAGVAYDLFEATKRPGGTLLSPLEAAGYQLEAGPNSLLLSPELEELLTELGLQDAIQEAAPVSQHRYVLRHGKYQALPASPPKLLTSSFSASKPSCACCASCCIAPPHPCQAKPSQPFSSGILGLKWLITQSTHSSRASTLATRASCCLRSPFRS